MDRVTYPPYGEPVYVPEPYPAPPPERPEPDPARSAMPPSAGWGLVGVAVLIGISAALPWATVLGETIDGIGSDGSLTLLCAVFLAGAGLLIAAGHGQVWTALVAAVAGGIVALIGVVDAVNVSHLAGRVGDFLPPGAVSIGIGLWLTLLCGIAAVSLAAVTLASS